MYSRENFEWISIFVKIAEVIILYEFLASIDVDFKSEFICDVFLMLVFLNEIRYRSLQLTFDNVFVYFYRDGLNLKNSEIWVKWVSTYS